MASLVPRTSAKQRVLEGGIAAARVSRPAGLVLASIAGVDAVAEALREMSSRFRTASVFEAGISYRIAESKQRLVVSLPLARVPATYALVVAAMASLDRSACMGRDADLNVICRRYRSGDRLGFHRDSIGLFGDEVFGAVLTDSGPGLVFRQQAADGSREEFMMPEEEGLVFASGGPSRYAWSHGVPPRPEGSPERVSITWRWLRPATVRWFCLPSAAAGPTGLPGGAREAWVKRFVASARAAAVTEVAIAAFLCVSSAWYRTKNDHVGPLLSSEAAAAALDLPSTDAVFLGIGCGGELQRGPRQLEVCLALLRRWEELALPLEEEETNAKQEETAAARQQVPNRRAVRGESMPSTDSGDSGCELPGLFEEPASHGEGHSQGNAFALLAGEDSDGSDES